MASHAEKPKQPFDKIQNGNNLQKRQATKQKLINQRRKLGTRKRRT